MDSGHHIALNVAVRTAGGLDGTPVILSAWCATCEQHAMPSSVGRCMFCDRLIYQPSGGVAGASSSVPSPGPPRPKIELADIGAALRLEAVRLGRSPASKDWTFSSPSRVTIFRRYGSWNAALIDAGLERIA